MGDNGGIFTGFYKEFVMVRRVDSEQMKLGQTSIAAIYIDPKSRDDIPRILRGLKYIYTTREIREEVFRILEARMLPNVDKNVGRPGMDLWKVFVLGVLRLDLNCDYDRLCELANEHNSIRQMLGHPDIFDKYRYGLQTLKDNVSLLQPEMIEEINEVIVKAGHKLLSKKKEDEPLQGRCDSFVLETDVHFPTDIGLLFDAMRKVINASASLCYRHGISEWRQHVFNVKQLKGLMRGIQKKKKYRASGEEKKKQLALNLAEAHQEMMDLANCLLTKSRHTVSQLNEQGALSAADEKEMSLIKEFTGHAARQIDQIYRRVMQEQVIPHDEKVFSLFEPHTEWISKGKAGKPVEFGVRIGVLEDQHGFILLPRVMEKETDDQVAVPMVQAAKTVYPNLHSCSFDKGFHSPGNQIELAKIIDTVGMKPKGKSSKKAKELQASEPFKKATRKHSAIESCINALEAHGLDKCYDHGIDAFRRYTALAIVTRNIHRIGDILHQKEQASLVRKKRSARNRLLAA